VQQTSADVPPGQLALDQARAAWAKGDYDVSETLFSEAIESGGLPHDDLLEAEVRLGAARAVLGKKAAAIAAFKDAAWIDPRFVVPPEAGKRAGILADQARHAAAAGPPVLQAAIPDHVAPGATADVDVTLDAGHVLGVAGTRIGVWAHDPLGGPTHVDSVPAASRTRFELPVELFLPSATVHVRVDWLDRHANRLVSTEERIKVNSSPSAAATVAAASQSPGTSTGAPASTGFWHTAWPYLLGGAALAAGGVAVYFATRPPDEIDVTGVRVVTH
jgi:tetratricopeptide (TPR) repeat protein